MPAPQASLKINVRGRVFRDGSTLTKKAVEGTVKELVSLGEERLNIVLMPRPAPGVYLSVAQAGRNASKGNYRRNLHPQIRGLFGKIDDGGVVYGPWLEGISARNRTTRFKGYASFRKTGQWLQKQSKNVLKKNITHLMRKLN